MRIYLLKSYGEKSNFSFLNFVGTSQFFGYEHISINFFIEKQNIIIYRK